MNITSIRDITRSIIAERLGIDEDKCRDDMLLCDDLGADSLDTVEIFLEIEERFRIWIDDELVERVRSVKGVMNLVVRAASKKMAITA